MAVAMIGPKFYAWDRNGKPLAFGKLYTYQARTNVPKPTYQSEDQVVENTNPVILNGEGYSDIYLSGSYKMVLKDDKDNEIWSSDPVSSAQADEWVNCLSATYLSPTSFKIIGNVTDSYTKGRKVRLDSNETEYDYGKIDSSVFAGGETTVTLTEGVVKTGLIESCVSIVSEQSSFNGTDVGGYVSYQAKTVVDMIDGATLNGDQISQQEGQVWHTSGYHEEGDGGEAVYLIVAPQSADGFGDHELSNGNVAKIQSSSIRSVKCFGAKADGTNDDTANIQAAIDYAKSEYFEINLERNHKVSSLLVDQFDDCVIKGGSIVTDVATTFPIGTLHISNSSRVKLLDLEIDGTDQGASGVERTLLSSDQSNSLLVQRCRFTTPGGYSISPQRSSKFKLLDCALNGATLWAVGCPSLIASGNHISNTLYDSVKLTAYAPEPIGTPATNFCDMAVIANNIFDGSSADFIDVYAAGRNITIVGNVMSGAAVHGVQIKNIYRDPADYTDGGSSDYLGAGYDITVSSNIIKDVVSHGIHVVTDDFRAADNLTDGEKMRNVSVIGNDISDCNRGVYFRDIVDISVKSNLIHDCSNRAIMSGNCKRAVIADNSIKGASGFSDGIYMTGDSSADVSDVTITGNKITGYTTGIYVRGYNGSVSSNNVDGVGVSGIITQFTLGLTCIGNSVGTPDGGAGAVGSVGISVRDPSASVFSGNSVRDNDIGYSFTSTSVGTSDGGVVTSNTYVTCTTPVSDNIFDKSNMQIGLNAFTL